MEKNNFLVFWHISDNQDLSLKIVQTQIKAKQVQSSEGQVLLLSEDLQVFSLNTSSFLFTSEPVSSISCNSSVILLVTHSGKVFIQGIDISHSGILAIPGTFSLSQFEKLDLPLTGKALACSLGSDHAALIDESGLLFTWGSNNAGQCGKEGGPGLVPCSSFLKAVKLKCGEKSTGFVTTGGHLYTLGRLGRPQLCKAKGFKNKDPFILPELEYHYVLDFSFGKDFLLVLSEAGEVFVYDDCRVLIKVPLNSFVKRVACSSETIYCQERRTSVIFEWKILKESKGYECNLRNFTGKAYKISKCQIFNSSSQDMYALVNQQAASRFLYNVDHELTWTVPAKTSSPVHSPNTKRTSFGALSKEFSLNIDNLVVVQNDSASKIAEVLKNVVKRTFKSLWESAFHQFILKIAIQKNKRLALVWKIEKIVKVKLFESFFMVKTVKGRVEIRKVMIDTFDEFAKSYKLLKNTFQAFETCLKRQVLKKLSKKRPKYQAYVVRICVVAIAKAFHKQKAQVFTLILRESLNISERFSKSPEKREVSSKTMQDSTRLMKLGLVLQSFIEKCKTFNILKGFRAFKSTLRSMSCLTPSLTFIKNEKTFAESFDKNFSLASYFNSNVEKTRGKKLSIEIPLVSKNQKEKKPASTDRRHSMFVLNSNEPKSSIQIRKEYDSSLKHSRRNTGKNKNNELKSREKERIHKISCAILQVENKFFRNVKRKLVLGFNTIIMAQVEQKVVIEQWKVKVFALGFHKFMLIVRKLMKKSFFALKILD
jgi:hypothetical protein